LKQLTMWRQNVWYTLKRNDALCAWERWTTVPMLIQPKADILCGKWSSVNIEGNRLAQKRSVVWPRQLV
jgi:hypothetical protein